MGPVRQNPVCSYVCASHCAQLLYTILHRTDLIVFTLTLQTITTAPMMSIWGKGVMSPAHLSCYHNTSGKIHTVKTGST